MQYDFYASALEAFLIYPILPKKCTPLTIILFDTPRSRRQLYPLSLTRAIGDIRHGIFTPGEWYRKITGKDVYFLSDDYLDYETPPEGPWICIDATVVPDKGILEALNQLDTGRMLEDDNGLVAYMADIPPVYGSLPVYFKSSSKITNCKRIGHPMDLVKTNAEKIMQDISLFSNAEPTDSFFQHNRVFGYHPIIIENDVQIQGCSINTTEGPVFLGANCQVMEGSLIRGPLAICENAVIKMGAQLYGSTTVGKHAVAGGEIKNSILGDYSNKAHHGYLGDSVIGQWCNLGAGTSNSNVKNNAGTVQMWSEEKQMNIPVGKKAGVVMGDFSKTAINTAINTGTTIGAATSIHKQGLFEKKVASFEWGPGERYKYDHLMEDLQAWHQFKQTEFTFRSQKILETLFHMSNRV
jgi:UDP-N-acetylglucosamine diphosphorylase / glucose-1-phosphate thymidylyltransferase / UDP-N-acetylgalactosamine diphosphorylase / glucosamine-1-phosphate N-acetyltransferase / galactosamine-1-phosphate N-acetyltransferase